MLVVGSDQEKMLPEIVTQANKDHLLTVSDTEGFGEAGVLINLFMEKGRVKFEVNTSSLKSSDLSISYKLLRMARQVE